MGREIYNIINDMAEVLNASQMQRLQEVLVKRLSENATSEHSQTTNVVYRKGDKERKAYFDAKTKIHLLNYIESRTDDNSALFVSLNKPHSRLTESGVELRLIKIM